MGLITVVLSLCFFLLGIAIGTLWAISIVSARYEEDFYDDEDEEDLYL